MPVSKYIIMVNMTEGEDMVVYSVEKSLPQNSITPQEYVNYFADRLKMCMAGRDKCAVDTLERMATSWGVYPDPALGVLLYSCNFTELRCDTNWCEYEITYEVRNFQDKPYDYTVTLIADDTTTELNSGKLGPTFSETGRDTITKTVVVNCDNNDGGCGDQMYLSVVSERVD